MGRRDARNRFKPQGEPLERRETPSLGLHPIGGAHPNPVQASDFHKEYQSLLTARFLVSQQAAARISQAFQLFEQNALGIPPKLALLPSGGTVGPMPPTFRKGPGPRVPIVGLPAGTLPDPPTPENLVAQLRTFVDLALLTFPERTSNVRPWIRNAPDASPAPRLALIPYANAQIDRMAAIYFANPPVFNDAGQPLNSEASRAAEDAFSNILQAVGEYSVHPNLFRAPDDFYINPAVRFTIPFEGTPAREMPGVFVLGPGGVPLPGARHPVAPSHPAGRRGFGPPR